MNKWSSRLHRRTHRSRRPDQIHRQRLIALTMIGTGLLRVMIWATMLALFYSGAPFMVSLFGSVRFVSALSVGALLLTDWGQVAASLAQLTAGDVHHDVSHTRQLLAVDFEQLDEDIARLADLQPGPEAKTLAITIRTRLGHHE